MASLVASLSVATQSPINFSTNLTTSSSTSKLSLNPNRKSTPLNPNLNSARCLSLARALSFASKHSSNKFRVFASSSSAAAANDDDEIAATSYETEDNGVSTTTKEPESDEDKGGYGSKNDGIIVELKQYLIDNLTGTDRGLKASSEVRAEIVEIIAQIESKNPTPAPTEALPLLNGKWILVYTSFSELFPLLAAGTLPLVKVGEISQFIDSNALTVENSVTFTGPLATTSFSTSASFEIRSPKRVQIKFEEGVIGTPQLTDSIEIPENIQFLGQNIDLTPARGLLNSLQEAASSVAKRISGQPPLKFPIRTDRAQSWLLTTYLDEDLRISRGDGGSIFVLVKEGSSLLEDL